MPKKPRKPFQRTVAVPRIDPDFECWLESWIPRSIAERRLIHAQD
jgi:hypothetical protein